MDSLEKLREVAIKAVRHTTMVNNQMGEEEAFDMINDCVDSLSNCAVVNQADFQAVKFCGSITDGEHKADVKVMHNRISLELPNGDKFRISLDFGNTLRINKTGDDDQAINIVPCVSNEINVR